jgi:DNA helicase-2/ATP-dependent DNA helicase PcrA
MKIPVDELPEVVREELSLLERIRQGALTEQSEDSDPNYYNDIIELRDALGEAHPEDVPALTTQIEQLILLSKQQDERSNRARVFNWQTPYFAHMRLEEQGRTRDLLLGNQNFFSAHLPCPIVDWKNAPVSQIFYRYQEDEEYVEELGGREVEGILRLRRLVRVENGVLRSVNSPQGIWLFEEGQWFQWQHKPARLQGGSGSAQRPEAQADHYRIDKHLPQITALIDEKQFEIITQPHSGVILIQGGAGSGKTTVALHRLAYLMSQKPQYYTSGSVLPIVFNRALANYISKILPSLGIQGVEARVYQEWVGRQRQRLFSELPQRYADNTPVRVIEFKRSPALLHWFRHELQRRLTEFSAQLTSQLGPLQLGQHAPQVWELSAQQTPVDRLRHLHRWACGREDVAGFPSGHSGPLSQKLERLIEDWFPGVLEQPQFLALHLWNDGLIRRPQLQEAVDLFAPKSFSTTQLDDIWSWNVRCYQRRQTIIAAHSESPEEGNETIFDSERSRSDELPTLDEEDDTLLLLLYQMTVGPLRGKKNRLLEFAHLLIDEVQDFSTPELQLLLSLTPPKRRSVTLAGDMDQKILTGNRYTDWSSMLDELQVEVTAMEPLTVGYRSTHEIMGVAKHVIGPLSVNTVWEAVRHGAPVERFAFQHPGALVAFLVESVGSLLRREPSASIAVLSRELSEARKIFEQFERADLPSVRFIADQEFPFRPGVEVTNIAQTKGLEFDYVILTDVDASTYGPDDKSRHLLYVGVTRAAHQLWLLHCGNPSALLPESLL